MSFQDEVSRCLSQAIEVSRSETEVGDCIRHNTEDKSVKSSTSGRDRERGPVKRFQPIAKFSKGARVDIVTRAKSPLASSSHRPNNASPSDGAIGQIAWTPKPEVSIL